MSFNVLIVDSDALVRALVTTLLKAMGVGSLQAGNGEDAIALFQHEQPDIVVMAVQLPGIDGIAAMQRIKALHPDKWIPVIMLTSLYSNEEMARGLEAGADDYILKPVNFPILKARITNFINGLRAEIKLHETLKQLKVYHDAAEQENEFARHVMQRLVHVRCQDPRFAHWSRPALNFSGDIIAGAKTPHGKMHVMLADGTGHGLAAAISVMPMVEVFYGMSSKGLPLAAICSELNRKIHLLMPTGRFVCAAIAEIDPLQRTICVWNGGMPLALCFDGQGEVIHRWNSAHLPLGVLDEQQFEAGCETFGFPEHSKFFLCSDGLLEAEDHTGKAFGEEGIAAFLKRLARGESLSDLGEREIITQFPDPQDDFSLVSVSLDF